MTGGGGDPAAELRARLDAVSERLEALSRAAPPGSLTEPDPSTGERWEWGQVWAHMAEFPEYWMDQIRDALAQESDEPVPFGRTKTDPHRNAEIERERHAPPAELWERISADLDRLRAMLTELSPGDWARSGLHPTMGVMDLPRIVNEFLVGHLEQHAEQLENLVDAG